MYDSLKAHISVRSRVHYFHIHPFVLALQLYQAPDSPSFRDVSCGEGFSNAQKFYFVLSLRRYVYCFLGCVSGNDDCSGGSNGIAGVAFCLWWTDDGKRRKEGRQ
uniref:Uncharacterized protein n=1 Tax=Trypanosoma congolense (strain IL3000) TaxID=1068625 RepID=G0UTK2_TRYCI|nr:hypothetical protein, unlikely [Trypanosoma congolense IL3000]